MDEEEEDLESEVCSGGSFTALLLNNLKIHEEDLNQPLLFPLPAELGEILLRPSYREQRRHR